jgi:signal transduction histidine kinase
MEPGTNLSPEAHSGKNLDERSSMGTIRSREGRGVRTHVLLVVSMALVIVIVTGLSQLLIRRQLGNQVVGELSQDLNRSVAAFRSLQEQQLSDLDRENALLAELPTLKALMTSGDDLTIQDGAAEFWRLSGTDLFVLADATGRVITVYGKSAPADAELSHGLTALLASPEKRYVIDRGALYGCAVRPLFFGSDESGTLLGYLVTGTSIERTVRQISEPTGVEAAFLSGGRVVASTLDLDAQTSLARQSGLVGAHPVQPAAVTLGKAHFLYATADFTPWAASPLELVVLKSAEPAEYAIQQIDRMVVIVGFGALLSGAVLMILVSRPVTRPLEELSKSVKAFGLGDQEHYIPRYGTQEVRELGKAFAVMRKEIRKANQAVLESERLATIGRMASSVSHDFRHYLAAIYANSEFLATEDLAPDERADIFAEIRSAVNETADMLESLLIFSRTGESIKRRPELMATLIERSIAVVRAHPDADGVKLSTHCERLANTMVMVDGKQIERAISNLLLNACQSARSTGAEARVEAAVGLHEQQIVVSIIDNGPGVPGKVRETLFQPFVSEGKQKGTGLGLTLAKCIAKEHGGELILFSSREGETIFQLTVPCRLPVDSANDANDAERDAKLATG